MILSPTPGTMSHYPLPLLRQVSNVSSTSVTRMDSHKHPPIVVLVETSPLQTPIWMLVLAIVVAGVFLAPIGIITAVSNTTIGLNVLTEL